MSSRSDAPRGYLIVAPWEVTSHGGVNGVIQSLVREMRHAGELSPLILQSSWLHRRMTVTHVAGVPVASLRLRPPLAGRGWVRGMRSSLTYLVGFAPLAVQIRRLCSLHRVAAINVHYPSLGSLTFVLLRLFGLFGGRLIFSFHGSDIHAAAKLGGFRRRVFLWSLHRVDSLVVVSEQLSRFVIELSPDLAAKVHVIYNGVDVDLFRHARPLRSMPMGDPVIISVASFDPVKGVDVLLRAIPLVLRHRSSARFLLVGESGAEDAHLRQLSDELGIADHVEWHCDVPHAEVPSLLAAADIFVLPSRDEALGMAVLEAAIVGLPVVATRVGGIPEIIHDAADGMLVAPENPQALADAILWLTGHAEAAAKMGDHLRQSVEDRFTWRRAYQQYVQLALGQDVGSARAVGTRRERRRR